MECESREHRECDPPETFFGLEAWLIGKGYWGLWRWTVVENHNSEGSSEGILGIETLPLHRLLCTPLNKSTILRRSVMLCIW
jgi:predicted transglutaminase-like protease